MAARNLYASGYEGMNIDEYLARLIANAVDVVLDVRELPLSRKKGFSKNSFRESLASVGIEYLHDPRLGCPKDIRDQFKIDADWGLYTRKFSSYIKTQSESLRAVVQLSRKANVCLVCFEADYSRCHRTFVARAVNGLGAPPTRHILAKTTVADQVLRAAA
jgi:uncharacterized protein (DUF488 family)